jgi:hypothetical protein
VRAQLRARQFSGGDPADIGSLDVDQDRRLRRFPQPQWLPLCVRDAEARRLDVTTAAAVPLRKSRSPQVGGSRLPRRRQCRTASACSFAPTRQADPSRQLSLVLAKQPSGSRARADARNCCSIALISPGAIGDDRPSSAPPARGRSDRTPPQDSPRATHASEHHREKHAFALG